MLNFLITKFSQLVRFHSIRYENRATTNMKNCQWREVERKKKVELEKMRKIATSLVAIVAKNVGVGNLAQREQNDKEVVRFAFRTNFRFIFNS